MKLLLRIAVKEWTFSAILTFSNLPVTARCSLVVSFSRPSELLLLSSTSAFAASLLAFATLAEATLAKPVLQEVIRRRKHT